MMQLIYLFFSYICFTEAVIFATVGRVSLLQDQEVPDSIPGSDIQVFNYCTSCSPLGTRIFVVSLGLVAPVSV